VRILYSFPEAVGKPGIGLTALKQVEGLAELGHAVTLMCTHLMVGLPPSVRVHQTFTVGGRRIPHRVLGFDRTYRMHDTIVANHLHKHPNSYDVVHAWPSAALETLRAARAIGVPALREAPNTHTDAAFEAVHAECARIGYQLPSTNSHARNPARLERELQEYDAATKVLVPSDHVAKTFLDRGVPDERLARHQYGYDPAQIPVLPSENEPLRVLFVGRCEPRKGLHLALEAWARSGLGARGCKFLIAGRFAPHYERLCGAGLALEGVQVVGFIEDPARIYSMGHVLMLPSVEEGSALVTYEARGAGLVPLVSEAAGARCDHGRTGLVHAVRDIDAMVDHLHLAADPRAREAMRAESLKELPSLTWRAAAARLSACYESAAA
jgi:glycosyltransferase involved in cell wall biosynthesis